MNNSYGHLPIPELKNLLRKRGASLRGKKKDLIERLILYDANNNFSVKPFASRPHTEDEDQTSLFMPDANKFKDLNADSDLPPVTMSNIHNYLERFDTNIEKGKKMNTNEFLLHVRMAFAVNIYYFTAQCKASIKKAVVYNINIHISRHGVVEACQCDCSVGEPPNAHCKHMVAVLLSIEQLRREKKIILFGICTERLQSFHKPHKKFSGCPVKVENVTKCNEKSAPMIFNPVNNFYAEKYREKVRNMCVNYIGHSHSTIPFKYTIAPANLYAIENDHNYTTSYKDRILKDLKLLNVSKKDIEQIEVATRNQDKSKYWYDLRKTHLTASNFYGMCRTVSTTAKINLAKRILDPTVFKSKENQHESYGVTVKKYGLILMEEKPFLGASPDGLIGDETVFEVKCPFNQRYYSVSELTIPYLKKNDNNQLYLEPAHPYYFQIQGQLMVTGRKYANLMVYTYYDWKIIYVPRNQEFINQLEQQLESFYNDYFQPEIFEKYLYKGYSKITMNDY